MRKTGFLIITTSVLSLLLVGLVLFKIFKIGDLLINRINTFDTSEQKQVDEVIFTTPRLYTEGNQIKRKDTGETVLLKGATSDTFRHLEGKYKDTSELFMRLRLLKEAGGNLITFWVSNDGYDVRVSLAERVVDFANENGMYVMWGPIEPYAPDWDQNRNELMIKLVKKFRDKPNVIYGLDAEPFQSWDVVVGKATKLGQSIRKISPEALLFIPGGEGGKIIGQSEETYFPLNNTIYGTEDYLAAKLDELKYLQSKSGYVETYAWQKPSYSKFPILITEMGGVSSLGFGSPEDLAVIQRMLNDIEMRGFNYQMHSLDSYGDVSIDGKMGMISGLGMFDESGKLNGKGKLYFDFLSEHPGSKIK